MKSHIILIIISALLSPAFSEESTYVSPAEKNGKGYRADWETYTPKGGVKPPTSHLKNNGIRLLDDQDKFGRNVDVTELAKFVKQMNSILEENSGSFPVGTKLLVQISIHSKKNPSFKIAYQGEITKEQLQAIYDNLGKKLKFTTKSETVKFECEYEIIKTAEPVK